MAFKKGDNVRTEDGQTGVILFVDKNGLEAQVALARVSIKMRTESLEPLKAADAVVATTLQAGPGRPQNKRRAPRAPKA